MISKWNFVFALILIIGKIAAIVSSSVSTSTEQKCSHDAEDEFHSAHAAVIISPLMSNKVIRELEIYWNHLNYRPGDEIALYTSEPDDTVKPIYLLIPDTSSGIRKTGIQVEFIPTSSLNFVRQCLKYHVAWLRNGTIRKANCLETRPNWMAERKGALGPLTMSKIFLPGTHDSASYAIHEKATAENLVEKYVMTIIKLQDVDILAQLIYGVRYLDIRVGYYPDRNIVWWANHGVFRAVPLEIVVNHVKTFLDNTEEIVIFDIQEFPVGFGGNLTVHRELIGFLEKEFAGYFLPKTYGWSITLNNIWASGKRLIIGYDDARLVNQYDSVWPCVTHQWGNVRTVEDLYSYLNRIENAELGGYRTIPRSAMAELTPNTWDVILNRLGGLRQMADRVNANVTYWYNTKWQATANIVAVDFVRSSGIIETAIEWNDKRNSGC
ncbi:PI-PLC X domain-containing protein 1-like [Prorops nasuta]|uniref:PI-PLC X domain-containing protein 1-like n=1 Tax=Prorops nasuta TaxID=863751 RepID=UPI0034CF8623